MKNLSGCMLIAMGLLFVAGAYGQELLIKPEVRILHVGEAVTCHVYLNDRLANPFDVPGQPDIWAFYPPPLNNFTFPYVPRTPGTNLLGPVELCIGDIKLRAPAIEMLALPDPGTNDYFDIVVFPKEIRTNESVDVVVEMQHLGRFKGQSNNPTPAEPDCYVAGVRDVSGMQGKTKDTPEWKISCRSWGSGPGKSGKDASGAYVLEGRRLVYTFAPKKSGTLKIGKELFHNIPADCKFQSAVVIVKD